ncbi:MAG: hypothetical protein AAFY15_05000 [Cyanobacteria bacterium J06648_11]
MFENAFKFLRKNGFFLSEAFFVLAGAVLLHLGFALLSLNATAPERMTSLVDNSNFPKQDIERSDAVNLYRLDKIMFSHMANCQSAGVISELRKTGRSISLHIQLSGSAENGCTEHYVYVSSPGRIDALSRVGEFSSVRVRRLDRFSDSLIAPNTVPGQDWLKGTLFRLNIKSDDSSYWDSDTFVDDVFWEKERLTTVEHGTVQGRISIDVSHLVLEWGRPWYLPYSLAPVISKLTVDLPANFGLSPWVSFADLEYDGAERAHVGVRRGRSFKYPSVEQLRSFYSSREVKSRINLDQPVVRASGKANEISGQGPFELTIYGAAGISFGDGGSGYSAPAAFFISPENYDDRIATVYVLVGVILGFGLALLVEVVALVLREIQKGISS